MASYIGQVKIGTNGSPVPIGSTLLGTCGTAAGTAAKVVTLPAFDHLPTTDEYGITIRVKFDYSNSASNPTLNVNSTGAKPILQYGTTVAGSNTSTSWRAGAIVVLTYDPTYNSNNGGWFINTGIGSDAATENPANVSSSAAVGTSTKYAREDHVHAISVAQGSNNGEITIGGTTVKPKGIANAAYKGVDATIEANSTSQNLPTSQAVAGLVSNATAGLTGAMHFKDTVDSLPTATDSSTYSTYSAGDVILVGQKEYVYKKGDNAASSSWILLGDEGSYALKSNKVNVGSASNWNAGSATTLGTDIAADDITSWNAGTTPTLGEDISADDITGWTTNTPTSASVSNGTLTIAAGSSATLNYTARSIPNVTNVGTAPSLSYTARSIPNVTSAGTAPSLTITTIEVVTP